MEAAEFVDEHDELKRSRDPGHLQDEDFRRDHGDVLRDPQERAFGKPARQGVCAEDLVRPAARRVCDEDVEGTGQGAEQRVGLGPKLRLGLGGCLSGRGAKRFGAREVLWEPRESHCLEGGGMREDVNHSGRMVSRVGVRVASRCLRIAGGMLPEFCLLRRLPTSRAASGSDGLVPAAGKKRFPHDKHTVRDRSPGVHAAHGHFCGILRACGPKSVGFRAFA